MLLVKKMSVSKKTETKEDIKEDPNDIIMPSFDYSNMIYDKKSPKKTHNKSTSLLGYPNDTPFKKQILLNDFKPLPTFNPNMLLNSNENSNENINENNINIDSNEQKSIDNYLNNSLRILPKTKPKPKRLTSKSMTTLPTIHSSITQITHKNGLHLDLDQQQSPNLSSINSTFNSSLSLNSSITHSSMSQLSKTPLTPLNFTSNSTKKQLTNIFHFFCSLGFLYSKII